MPTFHRVTLDFELRQLEALAIALECVDPELFMSVLPKRVKQDEFFVPVNPIGLAASLRGLLDLVDDRKLFEPWEENWVTHVMHLLGTVTLPDGYEVFDERGDFRTEGKKGKRGQMQVRIINLTHVPGQPLEGQL